MSSILLLNSLNFKLQNLQEAKNNLQSSSSTFHTLDQLFVWMCLIEVNSVYSICVHTHCIKMPI